MRSIFSITRNKLEEYFVDKGEKKFKATQVFEWIYRKGVRSFDEMTNLKKETIDMLKKDFVIEELKIISKLQDKDVSKYLFRSWSKCADLFTDRYSGAFYFNFE